mmetsp:Transcript_46660/g.74617  ORF Transcript_46660/g.74617 Transcript_46660/m.74617 type:complete len:212 (+) Transcript_46660:2571-3206(+)
MVGRSNVSFITERRVSTCLTKPMAGDGEMICHAPMSASARSPGSRRDSTRERANAGPPRITSSVKSSTAQDSIPHPSPISTAAPCMSSATASACSATARRMRSTTAFALSAHLGSPSLRALSTRRHSVRLSTMSSLLAGSDRARFSVTSPARRICCSRSYAASPARSTARRDTSSIARSKYSSSRVHSGSEAFARPASRSSWRASTHAVSS